MMKIMKLFFQKDVRDVPEILVFLLVEGGPAATSADPLAIRMVPRPEFGGARIGVGPSIPNPWATIAVQGISAFDEIRQVPADSDGNVELAPGKGRLRKQRVILVEIKPSEVVIIPWKRKTGRPISTREEDCYHLELDTSGKALEQALKAAFSRL